MLTITSSLPGGRVECRCAACGKTTIIAECLLARKRPPKTCGDPRCRNARHGQGGSTRPDGAQRSGTYSAWAAMVQRCTNPSHRAYHDYGHRKITICERWRSFENFRRDMGERPTGLTLERRDNNGNYEPENCRWATRKEQQRNRRCVTLHEYNGRYYTLVELTNILHCGFRQLKKLIAAGVPLQKIQQTPRGYAWTKQLIHESNL